MTYQGNPNAKAINATTVIPDDNQISGRPSRLRRGRNMSVGETEAAVAENRIVTCKSKGCETRFFHNIFEVELDLQGMRDGQKASLLRRKGCRCRAD
ncbi:hypothetical protein WG66_003327 [Moniliophthora roreri]|nr:hypothetical protein WG66_003327 [Moniliophthora roreri]